MRKKGQATCKDSRNTELQGYNEEGLGPLGTESFKRDQGKQERLLQFYQQQKKD